LNLGVEAYRIEEDFDLLFDSQRLLDPTYWNFGLTIGLRLK